MYIVYADHFRHTRINEQIISTFIEHGHLVVIKSHDHCPLTLFLSLHLLIPIYQFYYQITIGYIDIKFSLITLL